jgi:hypothetical protein
MPTAGDEPVLRSKRMERILVVRSQNPFIRSTIHPFNPLSNLLSVPTSKSGMIHVTDQVPQRI